MLTKTNNVKKEPLRTIYTMGFVFSIALALPLYINSSFLSEFISEKSIGLIYTCGSILSFFLLILIPRILSRFGNYKTTLTFTGITAILMFILAQAENLYLIAPAFVVYLSLLTLVLFNFDIFLEKYSNDQETGGVRGTFLTITNLALISSPMITGSILTNGDYWKIYLIGGLFMSALCILLTLNFKNFKDPQYDKVPFLETLGKVWANKDMRSIFIANLLLRFFYAWMTIYTPLYLHEHMHFSWSEMGVLFTIMLLPFVLFQLPAGKLADSKFGEKEMLIAGFLIIALSTSVLAFLSEPIFWIWATALFITRIGASIIEVMTETHFFKYVDSSNTNAIGFFRNNRPLAYTIAPLFASAVLFFLEFEHLFLILGGIMFLGVFFALNIKDSK